MPVTQILQTIVKFYTTEVQLKEPYSPNDWANYALSYVQYFCGKEIVQSQDGKIERINPKTVEEKYPWIPSAIKSVAFFFLTIPFTVIGTIARVLSLDSTEVTDAIFSEKCPPPLTEPTPPAKPKVPRTPFGVSTSRKGWKLSYRLPKAVIDVGVSSAPSSERKTDNIAWNALLQSGEGLNGEAAALYQKMQAMGPEKFKLQKQAEASQMLDLLLPFNKELLKHAHNPGTSTPNYAAVATFIEEQSKDTQTYCFPFFLRDCFIPSLSTLMMLGGKLNAQDFAQWEELDAQCQVIMHAPELKAYLNEEPPSEMQALIIANQHVMKSQALPLKAQAQEIMKKHSEFFIQLLEQLKKKPQDRSAILLLLNANGDKLSLGAEAFTIARIYKAESRLLKNFYDEPLFTNFIELYTSCFIQLHTAKFTIPSASKPLSKDLLEETAPPTPGPSPATPTANPTIATNSQSDAVPFTILLQSAISFSDELLKQKSVDAQKVFIETNQQTATYKPFNTRCYVIFALRNLIEAKVPLNPVDVVRWKTLDTQLEIAMQNPELKSYLDEEAAPKFKHLNSTIREQIRATFAQNQATYEQNIKENTLAFQLLLTMLAQTPLQRNLIKLSLYSAEPDKMAALFFQAKSFLAARAFTKDIFVGELYENYFNAYIACITRLQSLKFEIPFFSMNSPQAEPQKPAPSVPALPAAEITRINQELKAVTDFDEQLLAISPDGRGDWLDAQRSKPDYCYPFHWSTTNAETLKNHRDLFNQTLMKKWELLHPKCVARLEEKNLKSHLDESPVSPGECKQS